MPATFSGRTYTSWTPLRQAILDIDPKAIIDSLLANTERTANGCLAWQGTFATPQYPQVGFSRHPVTGKTHTYQVHRLILECKLGHSIKGAHAHHTCANHACVNPNHLQLATAAENVSEMMARQNYITRIRELELALASVDPDHPSLHHRHTTPGA